MAKGKTLLAKVDDLSMIKPGELIDIIEADPLTLQDRLLLNEMLSAAWDNIGSGSMHRIEKKDLRRIDKNFDRIQDSVERLVGTVVKLMGETNTGEKFVTTFSFLSRVDNSLGNEEGWLRFKFSEDTENLIKNSNVFARLRREMMFAMSSRYSLALYELLAKRKNLEFRTSEDFDLEYFRQLMGVPEGALVRSGNLRSKCLDIAFGEVNQLTDIGCNYILLRAGRSFGSIRVSWWNKDPGGRWEAASARNMTKDQQLQNRAQTISVIKKAQRVRQRDTGAA
jgi:plasmid replication initiation protein